MATDASVVVVVVSSWARSVYNCAWLVVVVLVLLTSTSSIIIIPTSNAFVVTTTTTTATNPSFSARGGSHTMSHLGATTTVLDSSSSSTANNNNNNNDGSSETAFDVVRVELDDDRDYPIYIGSEFNEKQAGEMIRSHIKGNRALLVTNDRIAPMHLERYRNLLQDGAEGIQIDTCVIPDGEANKDLTHMNLIWSKALELGLDRKVTFIALGGGVIGDMVGFAASVYQRGVNFIQIPTSVMAMVDSSVGGKTGVNHPLGKNMIGAFHQPQCVFIDTHNLSTLPNRELQSGLSEVVKYGLIRDPLFFDWIRTHMDDILARDPPTLRYAIRRSCENKAEVVRADELEAGLRATLNLGHTFGHAIENGSGYGKYLHGEAVSIGTVMAATMSYKMGWIEPEVVQETYDILHAANLPTELPLDSPMTKDVFLRLMAGDKKVANGQLRLILLKGELGNCVFTGDFDVQAMEETIDEFVAELG